MARSRYSLPHILGYHGCDASIGEAVLAGRKPLRPSKKEYDWLGSGIYFWVDSPERAWDWATNHPVQGKIRKPFVVGALIYPGLCLNLTDYGVMDQLRAAQKVVATAYDHDPEKMPKNTKPKDGICLLRPLDCAVIETLHQLRKEQNEPDYDSVYGVFDEGDAAYPGAGFKSKTHIQIAVRDPSIVVGYFRVDSRVLRARSRPKRKLSR